MSHFATVAQMVVVDGGGMRASRKAPPLLFSPRVPEMAKQSGGASLHGRFVDDDLLEESQRRASDLFSLPSLCMPSKGSVTSRRSVPRELNEREYRRRHFTLSSKVVFTIYANSFHVLMCAHLQTWSDRLGTMHTPRNPRCRKSSL